MPSSSLIPDDPSVLLTTAGMQQFKPYFVGAASAMKDFGSLSTTSIQKSFRTTDIEEVGDATHLTFFEMLGNFSFGGYFKKEAIGFALNFLYEIGLKEKIDFVTVFGGDDKTPFDKESYDLWIAAGMPASKIKKEGRKDNFWGPTGVEGPCGPTTEIYIKGVEIWNVVFNEYYCRSDGRFEKLKTPGVDTGMGLDRLAMVSQEKPTIFETDLHWPLIEKIASVASVPYSEAAKDYRIIADHIRGSSFLIADGILPSNLGAGYILRRIIRRMMRSLRTLHLPYTFALELIPQVRDLYGSFYPEVKNQATDISVVLQGEMEKFSRALDKGMKEFERLFEHSTAISGSDAFMLYESYGFPFEMTKELVLERGGKVDEEGFKSEFEKHKTISKAGIEKKESAISMRAEFQGVKDESDLQKVTRFHTATHLLHKALQEVLGADVRQMGSNITPERLRFDFSFSRKLSEVEISKISELVNEKIKKDLPVKIEEMTFDEAVASGAQAFFKEKYPPKVMVYSIGSFSREICGGPHVKHTSEVGHFKILKEEASSAGVRRIRADIE